MAIRYIITIGEDPDKLYFSSAVRNPIDPTNATYPDEMGNPVLCPVRLHVPKVNNKISDSISGSIILPQQKIVLENADGKLDDVEALGWFNITLTLYRSDIENPTLADFNPIFMGIVDYPNVSFDTVSLKVNNVYRSLTEQVCRTFSIDDYPNIPDANIDKNIPIAYGPSQKRVSLTEVDTGKYIAIDPNYLTGVNTVYDSDGNSIAFTVDGFGVISAVDADTADVSGDASNKIGSIIVAELGLKSGIPYNAENWDTVEVQEYINTSGSLNFYFEGGTVRQLVDAVLKSDNAFLFTKNNGLLTIRQWGRIYKVHTIDSWQFMKNPTKDFGEAQKYYNSSALVQFELNHSTNEYDNQTLSGTGPAYGKERRIDYPTDLYLSGEVIDLGSRLVKRFGILSEILPISSGKSTIEINLLDLIIIDVTINGRAFSNKTEWVVREVDPGQDMLVLEARSGFIEPETISGVLSQPFYINIDGVLSQPYYDGVDGVLSQPIVSLE